MLCFSKDHACIKNTFSFQEAGQNYNEDYGSLKFEQKKTFSLQYCLSHVFGHFAGYNQSVTLTIGHYTRLTKIQ
jgi:hypothetical protein